MGRGSPCERLHRQIVLHLINNVLQHKIVENLGLQILLKTNSEWQSFSTPSVGTALKKQTQICSGHNYMGQETYPKKIVNTHCMHKDLVETLPGKEESQYRKPVLWFGVKI